MKKRMCLWSLAAVAAILCGLIAGIISGEQKLTGVSDVVMDEGQLYLIDNDGATYNFIKADQRGTMLGQCNTPKLNGSWWNAYSHLSVDQDKETYVYGYGISMENDQVQSRVYRIDFQWNRLEPVWTLGPEKTVFAMVKGGYLYCTQPAENGRRTDFLQLGKNGERTLLYRADVRYGDVVSAGYDPLYGAAWVDSNGRLYLEGEELAAEEREKEERVHICVGENRFVYTDVASGTVKEVPFKASREEPPKVHAKALFSIDSVEPGKAGLTYIDVIPFHYEEGSGLWSAAVDITDTVRGAAWFDGEVCGGLMPKIHVTALGRWLRGALVSGIVGGGEAFIFLVVFLFFRKTGGRFPIVIKLFSALLPAILVGSLFLGRAILTAFERHSINMEYGMLHAIAVKQLDKIPVSELKKIDPRKVPDDPFYQKIFGDTSLNSTAGQLEKADETGRVLSSVRTYQWIYLLRDGELVYTVLNDNYYGSRIYGSRLSFYRDRGQMKQMRDALEQKAAVKTSYNDQEGNWIALYVPILDENTGEPVGILESGMSTGLLIYEGSRQTAKIQRLVLCVLAFLLCLIALVSIVSLYPLARLKRAVDSMAQGNLGEVVAARGRDEVADISRAFNHMSSKLADQMDFIKACLSGYEKFVPERLLDLLGREDITELSLGDLSQIPACVLVAGSSPFKEMEKKLSGEEIYGFINRVMAVMIPLIRQEDGVVDHMVDAGLLAFYPDGSEGALRSAISICERMNYLKGQGENLPALTVAVTYGQVRIGIVGQQDRAAVSTIAESVTLAEFLQKAAERYGARILVTGEASKKIPEFTGRYRCRMIGYLRLEAAKTMEVLYDVYDGDETGQREKKDQTRQLFAAAMEDFIGERFYDARQKFAQVLRINRDDMAAREYVYRCDTYYREAEAAKTDLYLDHY